MAGLRRSARYVMAGRAPSSSNTLKPRLVWLSWATKLLGSLRSPKTMAWLGQADTGFAAFCLLVAAASVGFLVWNFPPARIFLGDTGSTTLGFLVAACSLWGSATGLFPFWVALLVFSPFSVDATVTLLRRLWKGERIWEAHRSHYYQRLVLLGWGHRRTVLVEYGLMLSCAAAALLAVHLPGIGQAALALGWLLIYGGLMWGVGRLERQHATVAAP